MILFYPNFKPMNLPFEILWPKKIQIRSKIFCTKTKNPNNLRNLLMIVKQAISNMIMIRI